MESLPCLIHNTHVFVEHGLALNDEQQVLDGNIAVFPTKVFDPVIYETKELRMTEKTVSIHHYAMSWVTMKREAKKDYIMHIPHRIGRKLLGHERYEKLKRILQKR